MRQRRCVGWRMAGGAMGSLRVDTTGSRCARNDIVAREGPPIAVILDDDTLATSCDAGAFGRIHSEVMKSV